MSEARCSQKQGRWVLGRGCGPEKREPCVPTLASAVRALSDQRPAPRTQHAVCSSRALLFGLAAIFTVGAPASAASHTLVVAGLGGEPEYEARFRAQAEQIAAVAVQLAQAPEQVTKLVGEAASRDAIRREMKALADRVEEGDAVMVVLIGHGTFDGEEYRFNIPGPDMTGSELQRLLAQLRAREQLIVNATSASGATIEKWASPGRVLVTATKSGGERTATRFAAYWAEALTTSNADLDKNEIVTASEAFEYASRQVEAAFEADVALATEHARIEGTDAAERFAVARLGSSAILSSDPEVNALLAERGALERELDRVKSRRPTLSEDAYYDELEAVLVKFALLQRQIDEKQSSARTVSP